MTDQMGGGRQTVRRGGGVIDRLGGVRLSEKARSAVAGRGWGGGAHRSLEGLGWGGGGGMTDVWGGGG